MNTAAVGFQCPACVKEGARSTRSGQLRYGGKPQGNPAVISFALIAVNVAVWLAIRADGGASSSLVGKLALIPAQALGVTAQGTPVLIDGVATGAWWQVATSVFTHVSPFHLAVNMMALYFLGPAVEQMFGRGRFLALYLVSGLTGSAMVMLFSAPGGYTVGASGAIFGIFGALAVLTLKVGGDIRTVAMWLGLNLVITFTIPNISWQGHLGGLLGGVLIAAGLVYAPRRQRTLVQALVVGGVAVAALVAIVARAAALG